MPGRIDQDPPRLTGLFNGLCCPKFNTVLCGCFDVICCQIEVAEWVEGYWQLRWAMPPGQSYLSEVLPHPAVSLTVEHGDTRSEIGNETLIVTGVPTSRFEVSAHGDGTVFGIKFRPGGFTAMFGTPAHALCDRTLLRVADVEQRVGVGQRSLQRLFAQYEDRNKSLSR